MQKESIRDRIKVHPPRIHPKITNIGHGNPRYNSMLIYKHSLLLSVGSTLRLISLPKFQIHYNQQIGHSQIFNIQQNNKYIMVVNFQGLITLLSKDNLQIIHQFSTAGKEIRHSAISQDIIVVSCQLTDIEYRSKLQVFSLKDIENRKYEAQFMEVGDYYYPEIVDGKLIIIEHDDPNPKGRARKDTVMDKKLPIKHRIVRLNEQYQPSQYFNIEIKGDIMCTMYNPTNHLIFYLHNDKKMTVFNTTTNQMFSYSNQKKDKGSPICLEKYQKGIVYEAGPNLLAYIYQEGQLLKRQDIKVHSEGIGGTMSIRHTEEGFYFFSETGLHFYSFAEKKNYSQNTFNITNCGLSFSPDGNHYAIADFGGKVYTFQTDSKSMIPEPIRTVEVYIPVRSLVWCKSADRIVIGCVDGSLHDWKGGSSTVQPFQSYQQSINILRSAHGYLYVGTSHGFVYIYDQKTLQKVHNFLAHPPVFSKNQQTRQLFGSLQHYAQIWSLAISPICTTPIIIISSSEDQTQKVHQVHHQGEKSQQLIQQLRGHQLAVTSIDWKVMNSDLGQMYASCSDDKIVRIRDPQKNFQVLFEIETATIKEWHTLTYLCLEPNGHRVAIGSQNGYVFIYDLVKRQLVYGEKVHLGGVEGLDWSGKKLCTISSDLCISIMEIQ